MSANKKIVQENYTDAMKEATRFERGKASALEPMYTKRVLASYIKPTHTVVEVGCATGYYGMFLADKCKSYLGVDLSPEHLTYFEEQVKTHNISNINTHFGNATNLNFIDDNSFDAVLMLGPMYHLPPMEREAVFAEGRRICKAGGIVMFSYINVTGAYLNACLDYSDTYPNLEANGPVLRNMHDDLRPDLFFYTLPEEMEARAAAHGLKVLKNTGTNFMVSAQMIDRMTDKQFEAYLELVDIMAETPSCTGMSVHALLVCTKDKE